MDLCYATEVTQISNPFIVCLRVTNKAALFLIRKGLSYSETPLIFSCYESRITPLLSKWYNLCIRIEQFSSA